MFLRRLKKFRRRRKTGFVSDAQDDEASCLFVSSKGIMKLCETHQPLPNDYATRWPPHALKTHQPGGRIYVHPSAMKDFVARALPKISAPFVLVSGDAVLDINPERLGADIFNGLVDHPLLQRWHAQNLASDHPKIHAIPLGLDYHTLSYGRRPEWGPRASPRAQEDLLHTTRLFGRPLADRLPFGYSNWHFALGNGDRAEVIKSLPSDSSHFESDVVQRAESWRRNTKYFFTISPRGQGMDCHRTWEAILLGSAPIIPDLPINRLFSKLPVVVVKNWETVTPAFLAGEKERILAETYDFAPVLLETWRRRIFGRDDVPELRMTFQDFMALGPKQLKV